MENLERRPPQKVGKGRCQVLSFAFAKAEDDTFMSRPIRIAKDKTPAL